MHSATEQLDRMAVDDQPSALTPPVLDSSAGGSPQPTPAAAPPDDDGGAASPGDGGPEGLTSAQQSVVEALAEMDSRSVAQQKESIHETLTLQAHIDAQQFMTGHMNSKVA